MAVQEAVVLVAVVLELQTQVAVVAEIVEPLALVLLLFATLVLPNGLRAAQLLARVTGLFTHLHLLEHWLLRLLRS